MLKILFSFLKKIERKVNIWRFNLWHERVNIVMIHLGRCGSTALAHHLQQHPELKWAGEIIEHENEKHAALNKINQFVTNSIRKYSGIEIKPFHLRSCRIPPQEFLDFLKKKQFSKIIFLTRKNLLRIIISGTVSRQTKVWHIQNSNNQKLHQIYLDPNSIMVRGNFYKLLDVLSMLEKDILDMEELLKKQKILRLYYEEHVSMSPVIGFKKICEYIGVPFVENSISLVKTNPFPLQEIITNFSEIKEHLDNTRFEWMLYDETHSNKTIS
jgi:hypothetical protein